MTRSSISCLDQTLLSLETGDFSLRWRQASPTRPLPRATRPSKRPWRRSASRCAGGFIIPPVAARPLGGLSRGYRGFEIAHLEQSDLIFLDRGDRKRLWETLGPELGSEVAEHVKWRYLQGPVRVHGMLSRGAVVLAVGESMTLLGEKSWYCSNDLVIPFKGRLGSTLGLAA